MQPIFFTAPVIDRGQRERLLQQKAMVIWFTGLSGAGKSTLSINLEYALHKLGLKTYILDGDNIRLGLNKDLSFTAEDRRENIRRIAEVCRLFTDAGIVVLSAFISPFEADRESVKEIVGKENCFEVFVDCPLDICEERDVKGLYKQARAGFIKDFTGINSPYEIPQLPDITINTNELDIDQSVDLLLKYVMPKIISD